jgi:exopolyphosphatase/guanosine-5'-triphosphate,3'-diphosphate pyrophosphatase
MKQYAIADIGSNTMVLVIYEIHDGRPFQVYHKSTPAHLIDYVDANGHMANAGIRKAYEVLMTYKNTCDEKEISYRWADITEPCRIQNADELVQALKACSFEIHPLSGYEEAACDYIGSKNSYPDQKDGIAFDVGGGSTELISFQDGQIKEAMSFHLGCVRLAHLPLDTEECARELSKAQEEYPSLRITSRELIGIGGTIRATGLVCNALYHTKNEIAVEQLKQLYQLLRTEDKTAVDAMHENVKDSRWPFFLPGMHMILEICSVFHADTILVSESGIREGFLQECLKRQKTEIV